MRVHLHTADLLVEADGDATLGEIERAVAPSGLVLDVALEGRRDVTLHAWIAGGAEGARETLLDPADHLLAGLEGRLPDGTLLVVRPQPRRAVGPDLVALAHGTRERFVRVTRAWLRVSRAASTRPSRPLPRVDLDPPVNEGEAALFDAIARELERT